MCDVTVAPPRGRRLVDHAPHGHWKTTSFISALRHDRLTAPMVIDDPLNGKWFVVYVQQVLVPTLQPGDIVVLDNLSSHKASGVREALEEAGAKLLHLTPYSPDLNPIEMVYSKLKSLVRSAAERTIDGFWNPLGRLPDCFPPPNASATFATAATP